MELAYLSVDHLRQQSQTPIVLGPRCEPPTIARCERLIARSTAMREITRLAPRIASTDAPVLIQGEPGVGKASVAREIHALSRQAANPFVRLACAAFRETELESELARLCSGELHGALGPSAESVRRGTLFLDGVCRLPSWAQVRLFDVLQESKRSGSAGSRTGLADFRLIASATCDLEAAMTQKQFHSGLYYYLDVVRIQIPPLRHRQEDIRSLAERFLAEAGSMRQSPGGTPWRFSTEAWQCLLRHPWPGNAWQLASVVAQAVVLAEGDEIGQTCILQSLSRSHRDQDCETLSLPLAGSLKQMERTIIEEVVQRCKGNKAAAARALGLHRRTLYRLLEDDKTPSDRGARDGASLFETMVS